MRTCTYRVGIPALVSVYSARRPHTRKPPRPPLFAAPPRKAEVNDAALRLLRVSHPDVSSAADAVDITRSVLAARACLRARL